MENENPKISIITVVYNGEALLQRTMDSVFAQTYSNIEYVVVDGQSKDNTVEIIKANEASITKWISERDNGLYDAMNKGLEMATGDFVLFMNAGDSFYNQFVVEKMFKQCSAKTDVLYGEVMMVDEDYQEIGTRTEITTRKLPNTLSWKSMKLGMVVCHQAFIPRRSICPKYIDNNLSADIDWVIKILKKSRENVNTKLTVANFLIGGVSKQKHQQSLNDRFQVLKNHFGIIPNLWNHLLIVLRAIIFKVQKIGKESYS